MLSADEVVYIKPLPGMNIKPNFVLRLIRSLYGLRSAPKIWNETLKKAFFEFGLQQSDYDPCLFYIINDKLYLLVVIIVDDILVVSNNNTTAMSAT